MSKGNTFENDLLKLIFQNTAIALIGDASGVQPSAAAGSLYVALHTADPGEAGVQTTSECAYTSYDRVAVARSAAGWTVADNVVSNAAAVTFPKATGGSETATHFTIGTAASGDGKVLYRGLLGAFASEFEALATDDTFYASDHGLSDTDMVRLIGGTLPTGVTAGTQYHVRDATNDTFKLAAAAGGAAINLTSDGYGKVFSDGSLAISNGIRPEFAIGDLSVTED